MMSNNRIAAIDTDKAIKLATHLLFEHDDVNELINMLVAAKIVLKADGIEEFEFLDKNTEQAAESIVNMMAHEVVEESPNSWIKHSEDADRPVLVTITNKQMDVNYKFTSKYGQFEDKIPSNLANNPKTDVHVEFLDLKDGE